MDGLERQVPVTKWNCSSVSSEKVLEVAFHKFMPNTFHSCELIVQYETGSDYWMAGQMCSWPSGGFYLKVRPPVNDSFQRIVQNTCSVPATKECALKGGDCNLQQTCPECSYYFRLFCECKWKELREYSRNRGDQQRLDHCSCNAFSWMNRLCHLCE